MTFETTPDALFATGGRWDPSARRNTGMGLAAYGLDGGRRFQLFDGEHVWIALIHGGRAWIGGTGTASSEPLRIVDLAGGRVVGTREAPLPWLLLGAGRSE